MTSKQRAYLRGLANTMEPIFQVGKGGISEVLIEQLDNAIEARELIKITVLETAPGSAKELAVQIANSTNSEVVQTIGNKITLFRQKKKIANLNFNKVFEAKKFVEAIPFRMFSTNFIYNSDFSVDKCKKKCYYINCS